MNVLSLCCFFSFFIAENTSVLFAAQTRPHTRADAEAAVRAGSGPRLKQTLQAAQEMVSFHPPPFFNSKRNPVNTSLAIFSSD